MKSYHVIMSAKLKPILLLVLLNSAGSVFPQAVHDVLSGLQEKFTSYVKAIPREEVFAHTDREEYIAGEEIFFTIYAIDRQTSKTSLFSRIAYVELWNTHNVAIIRKRFLLNDGIGPGNFTLPDTMNTGVYILRIYTNWMKNFLPDNCFIKEIIVYNLLNDEKPLVSMPVKPRIRNNPPQYQGSGISLSIDRTSEENIRLKIRADSADANNRILHAFIHTNGNISFTGTYPVNGDSLNISVPRSSLEPGINHITLFNIKGKPVAERFIYTALPEQPVISLHCRDIYRLKDRIELELEIAENVPASFSFSVAPGLENRAGMREYMLLGTEFGFRSNDLDEHKTGDQVKYMDSLLSHTHSSWIDWTYIADDKIPELRFPMEKEHHLLSGRLTDENTDSVDFIIMCVPGRDALFQYAIPDPSGAFSFKVSTDEILKDFVIMHEGSNRQGRIAIESSFSEKSPVNSQTGSLILNVPSHIPKWSVNYQVRRLYGISETSKSTNQARLPDKMTRFYGKPDFELIMADYISLPLMEEVFYEILPHVSIRKKDRGNEIIITDRIDNRPFMTIPCLMIDGVIIKDPDLIINMDPEIVEKIDVITEKYVVGKYEFPGIVNVITKSADFNSVPLPGYMARISYRVADSTATFYSPDHSTAESDNRLPDYRNTLYWNPALQIDTIGKARITFFSSDNPSDYTITIQGISKNGEIYSQKRKISVQN